MLSEHDPIHVAMKLVKVIYKNFFFTFAIGE